MPKKTKARETKKQMLCGELGRSVLSLYWLIPSYTLYMYNVCLLYTSDAADE